MSSLRPRPTIRTAERLIGRLVEVGRLWEAFHRAQRGGMVLVLVEGPAGIGKTRLVESLVEPMEIEGARVGTGCWVRQRTGPFEGLLSGLDRLVHRLLQEPEPLRVQLRSSLEQELGEGLSLLNGLLPELELLVGPQPPPAAMTPREAQQRFELLLHRLLACFAAISSPLVLFLDDLQWAEPSSAELLVRLAERYQGAGLLLILARRHPCAPPCLDPRVLRGAESTELFERLELGSLSAEEVTALVAEVLSSPMERVEPLARLAYESVGGSPWSVERFLAKLHAFGALRREADAWRWSLDEARELAALPEGPELVGGAVSSLPRASRALIELAACLGPELDGELLGLASKCDEIQLEELLSPAGALIRRIDPGETEGFGRWRFRHEKVHRGIYSGLSDDRRRTLHRRIVRRLHRDWSRHHRVRVLFALADQLHQLPTRGERASAREARLELLVEAGERAVQGAAWDAAELHLGAALEVFPGSEGSRELGLRLHRALAHALQAKGCFDQALAQLDAALACHTGLEQRVALCVQRTDLLVHAARYAEATDHALHALTLVGLDLPARGDAGAWQTLSGQEMIRQGELLTGREIEGLVDAPSMPAGLETLELALLGALAPPAYVFPAIMPWVAFRMSNLCLEYGLGPEAPLAFAYLGLLSCSMGRYRAGQGFGRLAVEIERRNPDRRLYAPVIHLYVNFINHWTRSMDSGLELGLRAVTVATQHGQFDYAGWLAMNGALGLFYRGQPLEGALQRCIEQLRLCRDVIRYQDAATVTSAVVLAMAELAGRHDLIEEQGLADVDVDSLAALLPHYPVARAHVYLVHMFRAVVARDWPRARRFADALLPDLPTAAGMQALAEFALLEILLICEELPGCAGRARERSLTRARAQLASLEGWAKACPATHAHKHALALAELAAVEGDAATASEAYLQALEGASTAGFLQHEALACRRAARFHRVLGHERMARWYRVGASDALARWGGVEPRDEVEAPPDLVSSERLADDPQAAVVEFGRATRSLSEGLDPARLIVELAQQVAAFAGATRVGFFLHDGEQILLLASVEQGRGRASVSPLTTVDGWPSELIGRAFAEGGLCAARAGEALAELANPEAWAWRCVPCPVGERPGLLYLEHQHRAEAFADLDASALRSLAALALTAMEDLTRYADLARLSRSLEASSSKLARHSATLQAEVLEWAGDLEALHEEHQSTLEALLDGVVRVDLQGRILYANPAAARITGFSAEQLVGTSGTELLVPLDKQGAALTPDRTRQPLDTPTDAPFNAVVCRQDGERVSVEFRWSPVFRPDGALEGGVIAIRDTTQRQQLEQQLRQAQKMEAMGRFAGGMAHDLNNLLTPIRGHLERIRHGADGDPELARRAEAAGSAAERATALVKQVLAFSRRAEVFRRPHDLVPIVDDVVEFLRRSMDRAIELRWEAPGGDHWFLGDAGLIQQVLLNLGLNARHALEELQEKGKRFAPTITIALDRAGRDERGGRLPRGLPDPCLVLTVRDNGVGMEPGVMARIFEPFFTTKSTERGTGLGLAVVYGILDQHGGRVTVASQPGEGATFTCYLPACEPERVVRTELPRREPGQGGGQLVLVVDDEAPVRELAREVLEEFGYRVVEAPDGETALDIHRRRRAEIDLVLLDLVMPGISGSETLRRLLDVHPSLPVVLWSGYSVEDDLSAAAAAKARAFLEKPFELSGLVLTVQEVLGQAGG
jgi:PAS domain S-box-containing protein